MFENVKIFQSEKYINFQIQEIPWISVMTNKNKLILKKHVMKKQYTKDKMSIQYFTKKILLVKDLYKLGYRIYKNTSRSQSDCRR